MEFKITYEVKGQRRKELVQAISEFLNTIAKYKGVPTCAYEIGDLVVDREGAVILNDSMTPAEIDRMVTVLEEQGFQPTNYGENAFDGIEVAMPRDMFTDKTIENLHKIVNAKGELIRKAIDTMDLRIIENDVKVKFPWFPKTENSEEVAHYTQFIEALCKMAIERNRVASTPRESENEKYDFRCFLLRLGFIGDEYKALRKFLLRNLTGNAAFKHGRPKKDEN
ncbi:virulence protein [Priestia flexa]|uniref:virulence protein n=1 Tax=Priestia flexa TaxID=86664 RepID=UPI003D00C20C